MNYIEVNQNIQEYHATKDSIDNARGNGVDIENAALQLKIIEINEWLAREQWYNSNIWSGPFVPDAIDDLEPLK